MTVRSTKYGDIEMDDAAWTEYLRQQGDNSHEAFIAPRPKVATVDDQGQVKQLQRRSKAFQEMMAGPELTRVAPGTGVSVEYISFDRYAYLQEQYKTALAQGATPQKAWEGVGYQPLPVYLPKLTRERVDPATGQMIAKMIRPILKHEVGIRPDGVILLLEDKFPGDVGTVVVPGADLKGGA